MSTDQKSPSRKPLSKSRIATGVLLVFLSGVLVFSFISYLISWRSDQSQAGRLLDRNTRALNIFGKIGDWLGNFFIFDSIGVAAFIAAFLVCVFGFVVLKKKYFKLWKTLSHSLFFICWLPVLFGAITGGRGVLAGVYGAEITSYLQMLIGTLGVWMVLLLSIGLYFVLELNLRPSVVQAKLEALRSRKNTDSILEPVAPITEKPKVVVTEPQDQPVNKTPVHQPLEEEHNSDFDWNDHATKPPVEAPKAEVMKSPSKPDVVTIDDQSGISFTVEQQKEDTLTLPDPEQKANDLVEKHGLYDHKLELAKFQLPGISLLKDYGNQEVEIDKVELEENKTRIVNLLKNFNVGIKEIKATIGPTITLYEIVPEAGIRVSQIKKLQDDIALNLSALGIRIIAPMPGKGTIGIEVPNKKPKMVSMRSVIASAKFQNAKMELPVVFGKTISNEVFVVDLAKMPHLLMAGATGQGKSVGLNAIIASLLYKKHPSELKFVMVDPKKVELSLYSKIERHYLAKLPDDGDAIITDTTKVIDTLNSLCIEMDERYELLKNAFCKNIKEYNQKFSERKLNPENGHRYLPYIVLVIDEFADLIMTAGKEVEQPVARLAQLARAIGIHLIIATQRPSVNVITGMIKANFPARVAFRVISSVDSRTILDSTGAEQLVGKGDMLYFGGNDLTRLQCAFIDTPEVEEIAEFIGSQKGYPQAFQLPEYSSEEGSSTSEFNPNEKDPLFEDAARIMVSTQQGSTSMLQRQLKIGYNRAGRIVDQLEGAGIVGNFNGSKAREVLVTDLNSLEQILKDL